MYRGEVSDEFLTLRVTGKSVNFNITGNGENDKKMGRIFSNSPIFSPVCAYFEGKTLSLVPPRLF